MSEQVTGIVVSEINYGETSKIINIITEEKGLIGVMVKGAKSLKSKLRTVSTKLTYGHFNIIYKEDKLSLLTEVETINNWHNIKKDINKISFATFLLELSTQVARQTNVNIFNILLSGLLKIEEGYDPLIISNIIELKYLNYLGVDPVFDSCAKCGLKTNIKTISSSLGGYVCKNCYTGEQIVSEKTIKMIRMLSYVDISKIDKTNVSSEVKIEISTFLNEYYDRYTGLYLNSKNFLKNLLKLERE